MSLLIVLMTLDALELDVRWQNHSGLQKYAEISLLCAEGDSVGLFNLCITAWFSLSKVMLHSGLSDMHLVIASRHPSNSTLKLDGFNDETFPCII
jgi:hypothetical protein